MSERDTQKAILQFLALKRVLAYRMNTGAAVYKTAGKRRFVRYGTPGMADVVAFTPQSVIWIEVKGPKGRQSPEQREFQKVHEKLGHIYVLARSLSDVSCLFDKPGGEILGENGRICADKGATVDYLDWTEGNWGVGK